MREFKNSLPGCPESFHRWLIFIRHRTAVSPSPKSVAGQASSWSGQGGDRLPATSSFLRHSVPQITHPGIDLLRDFCLSPVLGVLVDQRRPLPGLPGADHRVLERGAGQGERGADGVPEVVEAEALRQADLSSGPASFAAGGGPAEGRFLLPHRNLDRKAAAGRKAELARKIRESRQGRCRQSDGATTPHRADAPPSQGGATRGTVRSVAHRLAAAPGLIGPAQLSRPGVGRATTCQSGQ